MSLERGGIGIKGKKKRKGKGKKKVDKCATLLY